MVWPFLVYLLVDLLCGLSVTESHRRYVFQDRHFHSAVTPIQQGHQGPRVHRPIQDGGSDTLVNQNVHISYKQINLLQLSALLVISIFWKC